MSIQDIPVYDEKRMSEPFTKSDNGCIMCPVCFGVKDKTGFRIIGGTVLKFDSKIGDKIIQRCPKCNNEATVDQPGRSRQSQILDSVGSNPSGGTE